MNGTNPACPICFPRLPRLPFRPRVRGKVPLSPEPSRVSPSPPPRSILASPAKDAKEKTTKRVEFSEIVRTYHVSCWIYGNKHVFQGRASFWVDSGAARNVRCPQPDCLEQDRAL